jgi:CDP-diacylglycerol--glycerol-3-phosphate 3-phosphatidyltransferase
MWNLPNILTLLRIGLVPVFVAVFYLPWQWSHIATAAIFTLAAFTDWVDGFLARKLGLVTAFGEFLDPVADKLIVVTALILLLEVYSTPWFALPVVIIIGRELFISALREWMSARGSRDNVAVSMLGKAKTWLQMIAIAILLVSSPDQEHLVTIGFVAIYSAVVLTLWSMVIYLKQALSDPLE